MPFILTQYFIKMEVGKSFSIDALLAKPGKGCKPLEVDVDVGGSSPSPSSVISRRDGSSPQSDGSLSPADSPDTDTGASPGPSSFIPRPGLLNPAVNFAGLSSAMLPGIFPGHPLYPFNGNSQGLGPGFNAGSTSLTGSAFHTPAEQMLKLSQASQMEWLARAQSMFIPRVVDYSGERNK